MKNKPVLLLVVFLLALAVVVLGLLFIVPKLTAPPPPPPPTETTLLKATEEARPAKRTLPSVINLYRRGDGESDLASYEINRLAAKLGGKAVFQNIDVDSEPEKATFYNVSSVPTVVIFSPSGRTVLRNEGYVEEDVILKKLKQAGME